MLEYRVTARRIDSHGSEAEAKAARLVLDTGMAGRDDAFNPAEITLASSIGIGADIPAPPGHTIIGDQTYTNVQGPPTIASRSAYALTGDPRPQTPIDAERMQTDEGYLVLSASITNPGETQASGFATAARPDDWLEANATAGEVLLRSLNPTDEKLLQIAIATELLALPRQVDLEAP